MESPKKIYDLEERTFEFARNTRVFVRKLEILCKKREAGLKSRIEFG